jgi:hypothetical protein
MSGSGYVDILPPTETSLAFYARLRLCKYFILSTQVILRSLLYILRRVLCLTQVGYQITYENYWKQVGITNDYFFVLDYKHLKQLLQVNVQISHYSLLNVDFVDDKLSIVVGNNVH